MNLAQFSIEKNRITFLVLAIIVVMGLMMYQSLARDSMPPYTIRVATIVSSFPGASPERIEQLVTDKIEKVAQELPELKEVNSTSRTGLSEPPNPIPVPIQVDPDRARCESKYFQAIA